MAFTACSSDDDDSKPIQDAVEYVDLDLPSGLKWATCNLGATKPEDMATTTPGERPRARQLTNRATTSGQKIKNYIPSTTKLTV